MDIKWIIFDMGNVLVRYEPTAIQRLSEHFSVDIDEICAFGSRYRFRPRDPQRKK